MRVDRHFLPFDHAFSDDFTPLCDGGRCVAECVSDGEATSNVELLRVQSTAECLFPNVSHHLAQVSVSIQVGDLRETTLFEL